MKVINIHQAKTHLSRLIAEACAGEEIVIAKAGKPLVKLVKLEMDMKPRKPGALKGKLFVSPDFDDDLPPEILKSFYGE